MYRKRRVAIYSGLAVACGLSAFAQTKNPVVQTPNHPVSSEWERMLEGLRQARPMPTPRGIASNVRTPPSGLVRFDPKTGQMTNVPAAIVPQSSGSSAPHSEANPKASGGAQPLAAAPGDQEGASTAAVPGLIHPDATPPSPDYYPYNYPFNTVFKLMGRWYVNGVNYYWLCSASSTSDFHLISAGHCVYNHDPIGNGSGVGAGFAAEMWAWPAQTDVVDPIDHTNWPDWPYGVAKMTLMTTYNNWINSSDLNWDFSFITMDRDIGDHVGWMGREWGTTTSALNFDGYPAEAPYVPSDNPFQYPGFDANNVEGYTCCRIEMNAYTYGGHSGGPVWRYDGTNRYVEGVNSTSDRSGYAEATLLTSQIESDLENTINTDRSARPPANLAQLIEYVFNSTSKGLNQTSTSIGSSFGMTINAFNAGYSDAGSTYADVYLTYDDNNITSGYYIGTWDFGDLPAYTYTVQGANLTIPTTVPPGTYYVGYVLYGSNSVYGSDKNVAAITDQTMNAYCSADSYESDNSYAQAHLLVSGGTQAHTICAQSDQDWAYFTLSQESGGTIWTSGPSGDTTMTLYNSSLQQIDFNDDSNGNYFSTINRTCGVNSLPAGTYYVQIQSYNNLTIIPSYNLSLTMSPCLTLSSLSMSAANVLGGNNTKGTVTLSGPAPAGGATVTLSSNSSAASVPASIKIASGATSRSFLVTTTPVATDTPVNIQASFNGAVQNAGLTVKAPIPASVSLSPATVKGGTQTTGTVTINGPAPVGGLTIALSTSNGYASVPATKTIAAGATSATFTVSTGTVTVQRVSVIKATANGVTRSVKLTITP